MVKRSESVPKRLNWTGGLLAPSGLWHASFPYRAQPSHIRPHAPKRKARQTPSPGPRTHASSIMGGARRPAVAFRHAPAPPLLFWRNTWISTGPGPGTPLPAFRHDKTQHAHTQQLINAAKIRTKETRPTAAP